MVLCKCKICGRIYDSVHSGSYSYCGEGCVNEYKMYMMRVEMERQERIRKRRERYDNVFSEQIRGGGRVGSKFKFRRAKGNT